MVHSDPLTHSQQNFRVIMLGIIFLLMFTAFNSLQNTVSAIYQDDGYTNLGKFSLTTVYLFFGIGTFFTGYVIRKFGYNKVLVMSSLGFALFQLSGLIIAVWKDIPQALGWVFVMLGAVFCGIGASAIWVAQGSYVSTVAGEDRKTQLFALFWMLMMSSQIIGNVITTFVLGLIGRTVYFIVLTALGAGSAFLFLLLPHVQASQKGQEISVAAEARKMLVIMKDPRYRYLVIYFFFPGLTIGFYATFVATLVQNSIPGQKSDETPDDYNDRLNYMKGYVFIALGVSQATTGLVMNRLFQPFCKFKLAIIGTAIVELAGFVSMLCFFLEQYGLCFAVSVLWGISQTFLQTNTGALIGKVFPGKVEAFSVYRVMFALGTVTTIILNILLEKVEGWVFLSVILGIQILTIGISTQIMDLRIVDQTNTIMEKEQSARLIP